MSDFLTFDEPLQAQQVGRKFLNLGTIHSFVRVPSAICVTTDVFNKSLKDEQKDFLTLFFEELRATLGCFLLSSYPKLNDVLQKLSLHPDLRTQLMAKLKAQFGDYNNRKFAVRSSGINEDTENTTFAGIYHSKLNVQGFDEIVQAIIECWRAYYSYTAIASRVRIKQFDAAPEMALIIQEMVPSEWSGVAFTNAEGNEALIEYVSGLGEQLVSGLVEPERYQTGDSVKNTELAEMLTHVNRTAIEMHQLFSKPADMEWAWYNNQLYILQVRPITRMLSDPNDSVPVFLKAEIYKEASLPPGLDLGECKEVYLSYVSKRAPSYQLAVKQGVPIADAHVIHFNGAGLLSDGSGALISLLQQGRSSEVVIDISTDIRQIVLEKVDVLNYLKETFALNENQFQRHTIILRDFIKGQYGFISRLVGEDGLGLLIEYSPDGLMNINRGIAHCQRIVLKDGGMSATGDNLQQEGDFVALMSFQKAIPVIHKFTWELNKHMPGTQLEWALNEELPYFVDFSRELDIVHYSEHGSSTIITGGVTRGPIIHLDADEMLYRLSIGPAVSVDKYDVILEHKGLQALIESVASQKQKPVIYVQRPYAILSTLFDYAAGFIFAEGSILCHLAILLREHQIPAVINAEFSPNNSSEVLIMDGVIKNM